MHLRDETRLTDENIQSNEIATLQYLNLDVVLKVHSSSSLLK